MAKKSPVNQDARRDLLIEMGCEDLPARYVKPLSDAFSAGIVDGLRARGVAHEASVRSFATPRRLAVLVPQLQLQQADQTIERLGPALSAAFKDDKPTPAALGFAKSCGVELSALGEKDGKLYFSSTASGRATAALLPEIFEDTLKQMDALVPKRMRWGSSDETFVRPVAWLTCLLGDSVIPLSRFGLTASNQTHGHRFHAPKAIALKSPADYENKLTAAKVVADFETRRALIRQQIDDAGQALGGHTRPNEALLEEVTALVEWPVVLSGRMEERFMALPPEVIIATIEINQRYFPVFGKAEQLLPAFITVSNIESRDETQVIIGNERVVRPRLSDALFFWEQDRKKPLADFIGALDKVTFQQKLGSVADKSRRIADISARIAKNLEQDSGLAEQAASLCKADLVTRMVFEFPELQGVMGGYYAQGWGGNAEVSRAIREHYQPTQSGGPIPSTPLGCIIALADKLDTLAGIFSAGQKPTSSKDPYALRRAALGVLRILVEAELDLDLRELIAFAIDAQPGARDAALVEEVLQFHWDRLRGYYTEGGVAVEVFESVLATRPTRPLDIAQRIHAVVEFRKLPEAEKLAAAHKRVRNILRQARERNEPVAAEINRALAEPAELALLDALGQLQKTHPAVFGGEEKDRPKDAAAAMTRYQGALKGLAALQVPLDTFFTAVMVMAEDPAVRANRLALLTELDGLCRAVVDISCLPG